MKRTLLAALLFLGTAALADDVDQTANKADEKVQSKDATDTTGYIKKNWDQFKQQADIYPHTPENQTISKNDPNAFRMKGTVAEAHEGHIVVSRNNLPEANLDVRKNTDIFLDGKRVEAKFLPKGADINARFELAGGDAVALRIDAKSPEAGVGGSGSAKTEMKEDKTEMKEEKNESPQTEKMEQKTGEAKEQMNESADTAKAKTKKAAKETKSEMKEGSEKAKVKTDEATDKTKTEMKETTTKTKKGVTGHTGSKKGPDAEEVPVK